MKRRTSFYFYYVGTPPAHKHVMRMIAVFSLQTGSGQRAQSMDSDHSGSVLFVKVSAPYTHNPESGTGQTRSRAGHRRSRICLQGLRQQILDFFVQPKIFRVFDLLAAPQPIAEKKTRNTTIFSPHNTSIHHKNGTLTPTPSKKTTSPVSSFKKSSWASRNAAGFKTHLVSLHTSH